MPASVLDKLPPDTGVITVMRSDQLSATQAAVQAVRVLSTGLLVLVLALYALAIYLARGQRRQTLRNIGWAFVLVGLLVLVVRRVAGNLAVDALTGPPGERAGKEAWLVGSAILSQIGWATILYGVFALAGSILAGPTASATAVRRRMAPVLNERPGIAWAAVSAGFPPARPVGRHPCASHRLGHRAAGRVDRNRRRGAAPPDAPGVPAGQAGQPSSSRPAREADAPPRGPVESPAEEISRLGELRAAGSITDEEFDRGKRLVLRPERHPT